MNDTQKVTAMQTWYRTLDDLDKCWQQVGGYDAGTLAGLFGPQPLPDPDNAPQALQDAHDEATEATNQVLAGNWNFRPQLTMQRLVQNLCEVWTAAQPGFAIAVPVEHEINWQNHPRCPTTKPLPRITGSQIRTLAVYTGMVFGWGPNANLQNLANGRQRKLILMNLGAPVVRHVSVYQWWMLLIRHGDENHLLLPFDRFLNQCSPGSMMYNLLNLIKDHGVYSWDKLGTMIQPGHADYNVNHDLDSITKGIPFEIAAAFRYLFVNFPIPNEDKMFLTDAQKAALKNRVVEKLDGTGPVPALF